MVVSIIVAVGPDGVIGLKGALPWHLPRDLKRFRTLTWGKPIIMGRKTHASLGRALPGRHNIVITRQPEFEAPGCEVVGSFEQALEAADRYARRHAEAGDEAVVIGGARVFAEAWPRTERLYLTEVTGEFAGDTFFPTWPLPLENWRVVREEICEADGSNPHVHRFLWLERRLNEPPHAPGAHPSDPAMPNPVGPT